MECAVKYSLFAVRCKVSVCVKSKCCGNFLTVNGECGGIEYLDLAGFDLSSYFVELSLSSLSCDSFVEFCESYVAVSKTVLAVILIYRTC